MNLHALFCRKPPCGGSRRPRLRHGATLISRTRLLHVIHDDPVLQAAAECTRPTVFAERPLLTGVGAAYCPRLGHRAGVAPKPGTRSPARVAFGRTSYARATLAVVPHLSAIGSRRAIFDFACPPFAEARTPRRLSPAFASDFLGRGRLLPLSGFNTTTTPCLRAAMGDVHHVLRLSLLGRSRGTSRQSGAVARTFLPRAVHGRSET